jgi:hypothetical protein
MDFEIIGEIRNIEPIARGKRIQDQIPLAGLAMKRKTTKAAHFAVCINNKGYKASLEVGKLYRVIPDEEAAKIMDMRQAGFSCLKFPKRW